MSPTRRSFVKTATATLVAAAFTWPAPAHAATVPATPTPPVTTAPTEVILYASCPAGEASGMIVVHPDGRVTVKGLRSLPEAVQTVPVAEFAPDEVTTPGAFLLQAIAALRASRGEV